MKSQSEELDIDEESEDNAMDSDDKTKAETTFKNDTVPGLVNPSDTGYLEGTSDSDLDKENIILGIKKNV